MMVMIVRIIVVFVSDVHSIIRQQQVGTITTASATTAATAVVVLVVVLVSAVATGTGVLLVPNVGRPW